MQHTWHMLSQEVDSKTHFHHLSEQNTAFHFWWEGSHPLQRRPTRHSAKTGSEISHNDALDGGLRNLVLGSLE